MKLVRKKLADIHPAAYNPRTISDQALRGLAASIERFGIVEPIIWNKQTNNIVGGHQRYKALMQRGDKEVDVVEVDLPLAEEKALNLTLNNPSIQGEFTDDVNLLLEELQDVMPDAVRSLRLDQLMLMSALPVEGDEPNREVKRLPHSGEKKFVKVLIGELEFNIANERYEELKLSIEDMWETMGVKYRDTFQRVLECCIGKLAQDCGRGSE